MRNCLYKYNAETTEKLEFYQPGQVKGLDFCVEVFIDGQNPQEFLLQGLMVFQMQFIMEFFIISFSVVQDETLSGVFHYPALMSSLFSMLCCLMFVSS